MDLELDVGGRARVGARPRLRIFGLLPGLVGVGGGVAAAGAASGIAGTAADIYMQEKANQTNIQLMRESMDFNQREAATSRDFQRDMSNTAYQRAMVDMKKAGLNPMLAFSQGGASTPSGSSASGSPSRVEAAKAGEGLARGLSGALSIAATKKQLEATDSTIALNKASEAAKRTEVKLNEVSAKKVENDARISKLRGDADEAQLPLVRKQAEFDTKANTIDNWMKRIGEGIGIVNDAASTAGWLRFFRKGLGGSPAIPPVVPYKSHLP